MWQLLADNLRLFALTPTELWLRETPATVFGIEEQLASPAFAPRALLDRFRVECLSTTDAAGASLADHRALAGWEPGRVRPTFRPDAVVALDAAGWRGALADLETVADREIGDYATFVTVLAERRAAFRALGGTATDHAATSADTSRLADGEAAALFANALAGERSASDARRFEAHMLNEFARMSVDDGLVMQLHVGSLRDHNGPLAKRFGPTSAQTSLSRPTGRAGCGRCSRHAATIPDSRSSSSRSTRARTAVSSRRSPATIPRCCSAACGGSTTARQVSTASSIG